MSRRRRGLRAGTPYSDRAIRRAAGELAVRQGNHRSDPAAWRRINAGERLTIGCHRDVPQLDAPRAAAAGQAGNARQWQRLKNKKHNE